MEKTLLLVVLLSASLCAQTTKHKGAAPTGRVLTIKGHHLGETLDEFLKAEPVAVQAKFAECDRLGAIIEKPVQDERGSDSFNQAIQRQKDLECYWTAGQLDGYSVRIITLHKGDGIVAFIFSDAVMDRITLNILNPERGTYEKIRDEFSKRIGVKPQIERAVSEHYEGDWSNPYTEWLTPDVHALLSLNRNPAYGINPTLVVESIALYKRNLQKEKAASPFD